MNPLFIYLLKASATVFTLWAFYTLCLRRMTFHRLNRYFFLAGILISLLWPALPLTEWFSKAVPVNQVIVYIPVSAFMMQFKPETPSFGYDDAFKLLYFAGILFMLVRLSIQIFSLRTIFRKSEIQIINGVKVRVGKDKINPFSFFGYIFLNPENHTPTELSAIILHEKIHETRTHSIDILLSEMFKIMLWFNPFSWLFCRAVKENIEFEVDRVLLHQGIDCKEYQYSLLKLSSVKNQIVITNHFNLSNLKTRIIMMNKNQSSRYGLAAYALVIPLILLCMVFSYAFAQNKPVRDTLSLITSDQQSKQKTPENALILLDGKVIDKATMDAMNPNDIYSVNVLKGKPATVVYGKKGKNGVVLITSKKPETKKKISLSYRVDSTGKVKGQPLYIINGKESTEAEMHLLGVDRISRVTVLKDKSVTSVYGDKAKDGVVIITMKGDQETISDNNHMTTGTYGSTNGKTFTYTIKSDAKGEGKGEGDGKSGTTFNVTSSDDGTKKIEKRVIVTSSGNSDDTKRNIIITDTDTKTIDGKTNATSNINIIPTNVLILIDGKEGKLKDLNPDDIESVSVLKGEVATKMWGAKGENGVVMVTTKKGGK